MSCGVGCRHGSAPALLWLWCRLAAVAPIWPLAWDSPHAVGAALKKKKSSEFNMQIKWVYRERIWLMTPLKNKQNHMQYMGKMCDEKLNGLKRHWNHCKVCVSVPIPAAMVQWKETDTSDPFIHITHLDYLPGPFILFYFIYFSGPAESSWARDRT